MERVLGQIEVLLIHGYGPSKWWGWHAKHVMIQVQ